MEIKEFMTPLIIHLVLRRPQAVGNYFITTFLELLLSKSYHIFFLHMKKSLLILVIAGFLVIGLSEIQAQTTQPKLDQLELMKQFLGTWKYELAKDTTIISEFTPFGTAIEDNYQIVTEGKILDSGNELLGYDKNDDRIIIARLSKSSPNIEITSWCWTAKNIFEGVRFQDIANPQNATFIMKIEFKSPDLFVMIFTQNNKVIATYTYTREKK